MWRGGIWLYTWDTWLTRLAVHNLRLLCSFPFYCSSLSILPLPNCVCQSKWETTVAFLQDVVIISRGSHNLWKETSKICRRSLCSLIGWRYIMTVLINLMTFHSHSFFFWFCSFCLFVLLFFCTFYCPLKCPVSFIFTFSLLWMRNDNHGRFCLWVVNSSKWQCAANLCWANFSLVFVIVFILLLFIYLCLNLILLSFIFSSQPSKL